MGAKTAADSAVRRACAARSRTSGRAQRRRCRNSTCRCRSKPIRWTSLKSAPDAQAAVRVRRRRATAFSFKTSSLFFGSSLGSPESIERWRPGEEPDHRDARRGSRSRHEGDGLAAGRCRRPGQGRRDGREHRAEGRSQFRQPARQDAGRAARPVRREVARQVGKVPGRSRSISKPAARRCAARSRWRRWC